MDLELMIELLNSNDIYREVYESQVKGADNNESK